MSNKIILHSDINNFYASVEIRLNPELNGKAVCVCGKAELRHGIVLAKSNLAKSFGIKTGDTIWQARLKCPDVVVVEPHYSHYTKFSNIIYNIYTHYTNLVEPFGLDECWLDVTNSQHLFGDGITIAKKISAEILDSTGLTVSIGVSYNKIFAKLGSDIKKPAGITEITKENYKTIIWPRPVTELLMVGNATMKHLKLLNISTIGQLAVSDEQLLKEHLGVNGLKLISYANGNFNENVAQMYTQELPDSVGHGTTPPQDLKDFDSAKVLIFALSEMVATRLRKYGLMASGIALTIKYTNLDSITRQTIMLMPSSTTLNIAQTTLELLRKIHNFADGALRAITVSCHKLISEREFVQPSLLMDDPNKQIGFENCVDVIRQKYGFSKMFRANQLGGGELTKRLLLDEEFIPFDKRPK